MKGFTHLCIGERRKIQQWLEREKSLRYIAEKLDRSVSSISDERRVGSVSGVYAADNAAHKASVARKESKLQCLKVAMDPALKAYVTAQITDDQSPEGVSGRLKHVETSLSYASTKAVYKFVYSPHGRKIEKHLYQNAVRKKLGRARGTKVTLDGRIMIDKRPQKVETRKEFGHFEGDFIESGTNGKGSLLVLVERKTRYPFILYCADRTTAVINREISTLLDGIPMKSLTLDNDISFQKHEELSELIQAMVFFCHPFSSWEKGTVENRNRAIRRYAPKRTDMSTLGSELIVEITRKLRTRFMKCLDYNTPQELFDREMAKQKIPRGRGMVRDILPSNLGVRIEGVA